MFGLGKKRKRLSLVRSLITDLSVGSLVINPQFDIATSLLMLTGGSLAIPYNFLVTDRALLYSWYYLRLRGHLIPVMPGVMVVGDRNEVSGIVRKHSFIHPLSTALADELSNAFMVLSEHFSRFPRVLVIVAQSVPEASLPALIKAVGSKSWINGRGGKVGGRLVYLTPVLNSLTGLWYGDSVTITEAGDVSDKEFKDVKFGKFVVHALTTKSVSTFFMVANASVIHSVLGVDVKPSMIVDRLSKVFESRKALLSKAPKKKGEGSKS